MFPGIIGMQQAHGYPGYPPGIYPHQGQVHQGQIPVTSAGERPGSRVSPHPSHRTSPSPHRDKASPGGMWPRQPLGQHSPSMASSTQMERSITQGTLRPSVITDAPGREERYEQSNPSARSQAVSPRQYPPEGNPYHMGQRRSPAQQEYMRRQYQQEEQRRERGQQERLEQRHDPGQQERLDQRHERGQQERLEHEKMKKIEELQRHQAQQMHQLTQQQHQQLQQQVHQQAQQRHQEQQQRHQEQQQQQQQHHQQQQQSQHGQRGMESEPNRLINIEEHIRRELLNQQEEESSRPPSKSEMETQRNTSNRSSPAFQGAHNLKEPIDLLKGFSTEKAPSRERSKTGTLTAANLIDAIIIHQINQSNDEPESKYKMDAGGGGTHPPISGQSSPQGQFLGDTKSPTQQVHGKKRWMQSAHSTPHGTPHSTPPLQTGPPSVMGTPPKRPEMDRRSPAVAASPDQRAADRSPAVSSESGAKENNRQSMTLGDHITSIILNDYHTPKPQTQQKSTSNVLSLIGANNGCKYINLQLKHKPYLLHPSPPG